MNEKIGVVDWFTKERMDYVYGTDSDKDLDCLIVDITKALDAKDLTAAADSVYEILHGSKFYQGICSDTRLPVCSLFHHSKNTSGISACLLINKMQKNPALKEKLLKEYNLSADVIALYTDKDMIGLIRLGALLHDIGKPRTYTKDRKGQDFHYHTAQTEEIVTALLRNTGSSLVGKYDLLKILPSLASRHHGNKVITGAEQIIHTADMVSSAADRRYEVKGIPGEGTMTVYSEDSLFPHEIHWSEGDYQCLEEPYTEILGYRSRKTKKVKLKKDIEFPQLFFDAVVSGGPVLYESSLPKTTIGYLALDIMKIQAYITEADKLPLLRGGSRIIEEILDKSAQYLGKQVCREAVLFRGGGNLLALVPASPDLRNEYKKSLEAIITHESADALKAAVVTGTVKLDDLAGSFGEILNSIHAELDKEKQKVRSEPVLKDIDRSSICPRCNKRKVNGTISGQDNTERLCLQCARKRETGRDTRHETSFLYDIAKKHNLRVPTELQHIGNAIAVIAVDGNMMGRMFSKTFTPADYSYKSEIFDKRFRDIFTQTISKFVEEDIRDNQLHASVVRHVLKDANEHISGPYLGIFPVYIGGDDLLLIMNARGAIPFCRDFIRNISEGFRFKRTSFNGKTMSNPTVTVSCGVAIADQKFPIYFLLDAARKMEGIAKEEFRKRVKTNDSNLHDIPDGSLAITSVSSAMPGKNSVSFVLGSGPEFEKDGNDLEKLITIIHKSLKGTETDQRMISTVLTAGNSDMERLNVIKFQYSSTFRKKGISHREWLDTCEELAYVLTNERILNGARMTVPFVWQSAEDLL